MIEYMVRALKSIKTLKDEGKISSVEHTNEGLISNVNLEISSDVWVRINLGGINALPGEDTFAACKVIVREDLENHIEAVVAE